MSKRKQKTSNPEVEGESKGSLRAAPCRAEGHCGLCLLCARGEAGAGRGSPHTAGHGPSAPQPGWPVRACWDRWAYSGPFPLASSSPAPHPAWQTQGRPLATGLRDAWHSLLLLFALSSSVCMLCRRADVHPDACGPMLGESGLCVHKFCLVSSLRAPSALQPGMLPLFHPVLMTSCSFLCYSFLPTAFTNTLQDRGRFCRSPLMPSDAQSRRQSRR